MAIPVTPALIKQLRERTGVGMGKCKKALMESEGDLELAIENLRKSGMASAVKKEGRETNEGIIGFADIDEKIALLEVNSETDFVAKNDQFIAFVNKMSAEAAVATPENIEAFKLHSSKEDPSQSIDDLRATFVQSIGENIQFNRLQTFKKQADHSYGLYSHMGGKIVAFVELKGEGEHSEIARNIAMHVAAAAPEFSYPEDVSDDIIQKEKEIARDQIQGNKPDHIMDKILEGKTKAFFKSFCLTEQQYVRDENLTIKQLLASHSKSLKIKQFIRWQIGK